MLSGYRVLDLTDDKGFYCGQLLGSLGADVIKIERPSGDPVRNRGPFFHDIPDLEKSLLWLAFNTNKRGITLDIMTADGRKIFERLVATADSVVESFPPGYLEKLGLDYSRMEQLNPGIVMTSITPFGQTGPYKDFEASDLTCWAMSGLLFITGDPNKPPVRISHIPFAYLTGSLDGAWATVIALCYRERSGVGQHVDVSIRESLSKTAWMVHEVWEVTGENYQRGSSHYNWPGTKVSVRVVWEAKDGYISFMPVFSPARAPGMVQLVKLLDSEGMADDFLKGIDWAKLDFRLMTQAEADRIQGYFARFFQTKTKAELQEEGSRREIGIQAICTPKDILEHPQLRARDYWQKLEYPELGTALSYPGRFCLSSEALCRQYRRAPLVGEHNHEIYQVELGFSNEDMVILKQTGTI